VSEIVVGFALAMACIRHGLWVALCVLSALAVCQGRELPSLEVEIAMVTDLEASASAGLFTEILGHSRDVLNFAGFAAKYKKEYKTVEELKHRFVTFLESVKLVETHNKGQHSYSLAVNEFADMTFEEFRDSRLMKGEQNCSATVGNHVLTGESLPKTKDWREEGIVSQVKNQASCGSCWTFSTTGALEAAHAQATGKMVLLSEQQLVDCAGEFNNFGCGGGLPSQAFEYIRYNGGIDTEDSYPYNAKDSQCRFHKNTIGAQVWDVVNITEGAETQLKHAVATMRPVSVAFEVVHDFRLYNGGVYTSLNCHTGPQTVNHAVLAVGYGEDENGVPYWIIKNSWGADWGMNGYFNMEMGKNMCGVATCASYPVVPEDLKEGV
jgi:cathepsin H